MHGSRWYLAAHGSVQGTGFATQLLAEYARELYEMLEHPQRMRSTPTHGIGGHVGGVVFRFLYSALLMSAYGLYLAKLYRRAHLDSAPSTPAS